MRILIYLLLLPLMVVVVACGGKKGASDKESVLATMDSVDAHGLQRMQTSKSETDFKFKEKITIPLFHVLRTKVCLISRMKWEILM